MEGFLATFVGIGILLAISALVIYVVGRLGLGLTVESFGAAIIAAAVIAVVTGLVNWLLGLIGIDLTGSLSFLGSIVALIVAALVLMFSDRFVRGMKVNGFVGAIIAAAAIGVGHWLISWLLGLLFG